MTTPESPLSILRDLVRIFALGPRRYGVFLTREAQWLWPLVRRLALFYRRAFIGRTTLVAVVGSVGKSTTRRAVHAALACPDRGFSFSNYGIALAANVLRIRRQDRHAVVEAGIGGPGWMRIYAKFMQPDMVVVTAIKSDHFRSFPTLEHTREEKADMVRGLGPDQVVFLNGDDPNVLWMASQTRARVVTFGLRPDCDVRAEGLVADAAGLRFELVAEGLRQPVAVQLHGAHLVHAALAAAAIAVYEGVAPVEIARRLAVVAPEVSRMQPVTLPGDVRLIDDCYKGSLESTLAAADALRGMPAVRRVFVLGGIEDPPGDIRVAKREVGRRIGEAADVLYSLTSKKNLNPLDVAAKAAGLSGERIHALGSSMPALIDRLRADLRPGDVVLLKGRGRQRLQRVVLALAGREVRCRASYCSAPVASCDVCPLLAAPPELFDNRFIARYVRS